ncbi:MAG: lipoyl(octanoyl) transferase LipB [Candidatus Sericytochromatia bacterium]|nr:lipoyl(octanoyl) transferase LipB [Candidatus Sericytochromatia bacterium]
MEAYWLGLCPYQEVADLQRAWLVEIADRSRADSLLLLEHSATITLGRRKGAEENVIDSMGVPVMQVERGGDATYHEPGQLVGYPLLHLQEAERDLHRYLRHLEEVLILALSHLGLEAHRQEGLTGVWVADKKVASVGVAVRRWTTYHGFALNVHNDPAEFSRLNPCGLPAAAMGSIYQFLPSSPPPLPDVASIVMNCFGEVFERRVRWMPSARSTLLGLG